MKNVSPFFVLVFCLILPLQAVAMFWEGEATEKNEKSDRQFDFRHKTRTTSSQVGREETSQQVAQETTDRNAIYEDDSRGERLENPSTRQKSMEPTAAAQRSPIDPERFSTPIREPRATSTLSLAETTPTKLPFLTELQERVPRKESSPNSVTTRAISIEKSTPASLATKKVSFPHLPILPEESEEREITPKKVAMTSREPLSTEQISNKQLDQSIRRFKSLTTGLEIAVDEIAEADPQRVSKIAAIYKQAYPRFQAHLEFLLRAIDEGSILKDQRSLLHLGNSATQLLEVAFQAIDRSTIEPVKIEALIESLDPQNPFVTRNLPYRLVPVGAKEVEFRSGEVEETVWTTHNAICNLKGFMEVLRASDEDVRRLFLENQVLKARRAYEVTMRTNCNCCSIAAILYEKQLLQIDLVETEKTLEKMTPLWEEEGQKMQADAHIYTEMKEAQKTSQLTISEAREKTFEELYQLIKSSIRVSQKLFDTIIAKQ